MGAVANHVELAVAIDVTQNEAVNAIDAALSGVIDHVIRPLIGKWILGTFEPEDESGGVTAANEIKVPVAIDVHRAGVNHLHAFHEERRLPLGCRVKHSAEILRSHLVRNDVHLVIAREIAGNGRPVLEALGDHVTLPRGLGLVPVDLDVARGAPAGDHLGKAVVIEIGHDEVFASHTAGVEDFRLLPLAIGLTFVEGHTVGGAAPPTGDKFVTAIAIEVAPAERVAFKDLALDHLAGPRGTRGQHGGELRYGPLRVHLGRGLLV